MPPGGNAFLVHALAGALHDQQIAPVDGSTLFDRAVPPDCDQGQ
jgi:hypothetical protein